MTGRCAARRAGPGWARAIVLSSALLASTCGKARDGQVGGAAAPGARPPILLVTLDTTRADAIGPEAAGIETPSFDALAARGRRFRQAYATAPETLPSHASMLTGLYPAEHGVHENGRFLAAAHPVAAERLREAGYRTAAFVSSFVLARRFGLSRGFDVYDDDLGADSAERTAAQTTERALAELARPGRGPVFVWVHYFDPHTPYTPPEPFRSRYPRAPYLAEVAALDRELGRLVSAFEREAGAAAAILVAGDHGEGLGDHGEAQHGNLLHQSTMQVPLLIAGPGIPPGVSDTPVSTRRIFQTILDWAGVAQAGSLRGAEPEVVLGEAMRPFLSYGWQPQVMAVQGPLKAIRFLAGDLEVYDVRADPKETRDLGSAAPLSPALRAALRDYPLPAAPDAAALSEEDRRKLASLGYVSGESGSAPRPDAPRPSSMTHLFDDLERASALFVGEAYADAVPLLERILAADPRNLDAALRLATAHSRLGHAEAALAAFARASRIAPASPDVRTYLALHHLRGPQWQRAAPLLEQVVAHSPERLPALEGLALVRQRQGRTLEALALRETIYSLRPPTAQELVRLGELAMSHERTALAIESFEKARALQGTAYAHDLELGVLYLAARRLEEARAALDRALASQPGHPMALFKRAQVSVLLDEPDRRDRVAAARRHADGTTRPLVERERLFQGVGEP